MSDEFNQHIYISKPPAINRELVANGDPQMTLKTDKAQEDEGLHHISIKAKFRWARPASYYRFLFEKDSDTISEVSEGDATPETKHEGPPDSEVSVSR